MAETIERENCFVIIGAGQAGAWVARTLRQEGFQGRIVLIGEENLPPYERPPLSKAFLQGTADTKAMTLLDPDLAATLCVDIWAGVRATAIDRSAKEVICTDGRHVPYDRLFLTTGARPRTWPGLEPASLVNNSSTRIHALRTQQDALHLRTALTQGQHLLIIGGGWIGLEVAATARALSCNVTILEAAPRLCQRSMPEAVGEYLEALHKSHGVSIQAGVGIKTITEADGQVHVALTSGEILRADQALICIGILPNVELAQACGLDVNNGVVVDAQGRTSDPAIFAAGDVSSHPNTFLRQHIRLESWANAQNQAIIAAKAALGSIDLYDDIPWLWSDQYEMNVQIIGFPQEGQKTETSGTPALGRGSWLFLQDDGRLAGAVCLNAPKELRLLKKRMQSERLTRAG